jgi:hypothetical protein
LTLLKFHQKATILPLPPLCLDLRCFRAKNSPNFRLKARLKARLKTSFKATAHKSVVDFFEKRVPRSRSKNQQAIGYNNQ